MPSPNRRFENSHFPITVKIHNCMKTHNIVKQISTLGGKYRANSNYKRECNGSYPREECRVQAPTKGTPVFSRKLKRTNIVLSKKYISHALYITFLKVLIFRVLFSSTLQIHKDKPGQWQCLFSCI